MDVKKSPQNADSPSIGESNAHTVLTSVLPTLLRSIRHPGSSLTALLALVARQSGSRAAGILARKGDAAPVLVAVGGSEAGLMGPVGLVDWADGRIAEAGAMTAGPEDEGPWEPGHHVEWHSVHGRSSTLTLVVYGDSPDSDVIEELASPVFLLAELTIARQSELDLAERLKLERQERALLAASLQHDLRTPLSGILGFARVLQQNGRLDADEAAEILDTIVSEAEHMAAIVEDGLRREETGPNSPPRLQPVDPKEIAENAADAAARARPGEVVTGVEQETFITDPARLTRALHNLVDNALKYSPEGKAVRVSGAIEGDHYRFDVADSGPGVPEEMVPTLFQPYSTDPSRADGTGLGLHSVATIAEELGGRVCYARHDDWTVFTLSIARHAHRKSQMPAGASLSGAIR